MADQVKGGLLSPFLRARRIAMAAPHLRGKVLDVGCGVGVLAARCRSENYYGVDIDPVSIEIARARFPQHQFSTQLPANQLLDTIVALAVIEHIEAPERWFGALIPLMSSSGRIVLTTPHPSFEWIHEAGARVGLFSSDAAEENEVLFDTPMMQKFATSVSLRVASSIRFLLGANQLFVLEHENREISSIAGKESGPAAVRAQ